MIQGPSPLPQQLFTSPFRPGALGELAEVVRRDPVFTTPHRGVRSLTPVDASTPRLRALAAATAVADVPLAGWAAAHLLGATDLDGTLADGTALPVEVACGDDGRCRHRPGIRVRRSDVRDEDVTTVDGVLVTSPVRTAFDLARRQGDVRWAVADVDALLAACPDLDAGAVAAYAGDRRRWRGAARAGHAAALARRGARSRPESWMRVVWTMDAGLPAPLVNEPVLDAAGRLLGIPDLLDPASGLVGEYDGVGHRTAEQQHADAVRAEQMAHSGLTLVRASQEDLAHVALLAHRLRQGHDRARSTTRRAWRLASRSTARSAAS